MLTGKCKTRANFDRLVSNKTFWNAISVPVLVRMFLVSRNFEDKFLAEKFKFIAHKLLWRSASGKDLNGRCFPACV